MFMMFKQSLTAFGRVSSFLFRSVPERTVLHYGFGNRCADARYVLFLDYDDTPLEWIRDEVRFLQKKYSGLLGNAYIFQTKHGYHVVFLEKHELGLIVEMLNVSSCDKNFKDVPMLYARRVWILRQSPKKGEEIKLIEVIKHTSSVERSFAHYLYMVSHMGLRPRDATGGGPFDKERFLTVGYYRIPDRNN